MANQRTSDRIDPSDRIMEFFAAQEAALIDQGGSEQDLEDFQQAKKAATLIVAVRSRRQVSKDKRAAEVKKIRDKYLTDVGRMKLAVKMIKFIEQTIEQAEEFNKSGGQE